MRDSRTSIPFQTSSGLRNLVWGEPSKIEVEKDELCRIRRSPRNNLPELREREREREGERWRQKERGAAENPETRKGTPAQSVCQCSELNREQCEFPRQTRMDAGRTPSRHTPAVPSCWCGDWPRNCEEFHNDCRRCAFHPHFPCCAEGKCIALLMKRGGGKRERWG